MVETGEIAIEQHGSIEKAVPVEELRIKKGQYTRWEYEYIGRIIGYHHKLKAELLTVVVDGQMRSVDRVTVKAPNGSQHAFYFDVTAQLAEQSKVYEAVAKGMGLSPEDFKRKIGVK